jgi:hypothetical protein
MHRLPHSGVHTTVALSLSAFDPRPQGTQNLTIPFARHLSGVLLLAGGVALTLAIPVSKPPSQSSSCGAPPLDSAAVSYDLSVAVNPSARRLSGTVDVCLPQALTSTSDVTFALRTDLGTPEVDLVTDRRVQRLSVTRSAVDSGQRQSTMWRVLIDDSARERTGQLRLRIRYAGGDRVGVGFYVGPDAVFAGAVNTPWYPQFDGRRAVGTFRLTVPESLEVIASAKRRTVRVVGSEKVFEFSSAWPTHLSFVAGRYRSYRADGQVPVTVSLLGGRPFADSLASVARDAITTLEREFGPYPFGEFAVVELPREPAQRSGFLGIAHEGYMMMRGDYLDSQGVNVAFFGHEIGHQWWGVLVEHRGERGHYMLDEALANLGALRVVETLRGAAVAERFRRGDEDAGTGGLQQALELLASGFDLPLSNMPRGGESYALSDSKGYLAYDLVAQRLGRANFRRALHDVVRTYGFGGLTWDQFVQTLRRHTPPGRNSELDTLVSEWFDRGGLPVLTLMWEGRRDSVRVTIEQQGAPYHLDVPVRIELDDGTARMEVMSISSATTVETFAARGTARDVILDPRQTLPHVSPEQLQAARPLVGVVSGRRLWDSGQSDSAVRMFRATLENPRTTASAARFLSHYYLGRIAQLGNRHDEAIGHFQSALELPIRDTIQLPQLYLNLSRTALARGDTGRAARAANDALLVCEASQRTRCLSPAARDFLEGLRRRL